YIAHLVDLDIPVLADRGRYGGYRLARGYRLPPLMLTDDEAIAVVIGLQGGGRPGGSDLARATAASKVRRVLPDRLAARLDALLRTPGLADDLPRPEAPDGTVLLTLADAVERHRMTAMTYTDRLGRAGERTVAPHGLALVGGRWYLAAHEPARGGIRVFRLDRITDVRATAESFDPPADVDALALVQESRATTPYRHTVQLRVLGPLAEVRAQWPAELAVIDPPDAAGWCRVVIRAESLDWLPRLIAGSDLPLIVDRPAELQERVRELGARLIASAATAP
ncbi:MAG TPA: WYL domain-containing protein, partial [Pseudolysinimonas sp.]|nr:WYL domain-containing protein [Pseudolysinimonas sp.]